MVRGIGWWVSRVVAVAVVPGALLTNWIPTVGVPTILLYLLLILALLAFVGLCVPRIAGQLVVTTLLVAVVLVILPVFVDELIGSTRYYSGGLAREIAAVVGMCITVLGVCCLVIVTGQNIRQLRAEGPAPGAGIPGTEAEITQFRRQRKYFRGMLWGFLGVGLGVCLFFGGFNAMPHSIEEIAAVVYWVALLTVIGWSMYWKIESLRVLGLSLAVLGAIVHCVVFSMVTIWIICDIIRWVGVGSSLHTMNFFDEVLEGGLALAVAVYSGVAGWSTTKLVQLELLLIQHNLNLEGRPLEPEEDLGAGTGWDSGGRGRS